MGNEGPKISIQSGYVVVERPRNYEVKLDSQPDELANILTYCEQADCRKALILGTGTKVSLTTLGVFRLGRRIAELGLMIAVVETHDATHKDVNFLENVVTNRGLPIRFFDDVEEAKTWLKVK